MSITLPEIGGDHIPHEFADFDYDGEWGPGGDLMKEGVQASNGGDKVRAEALTRAALDAGLVPVKRAGALCKLGQIHLERGELAQGVDYLLETLSMRPISQGTTHDAAVRLEIIYEAAGRHGESQAVAQVAAATANPDVYLAHEYAEELRALVRSTGAS